MRSPSKAPGVTRVVGLQSGNAVDGIDVGVFDFEPPVRSSDDPRALQGSLSYRAIANKTFAFSAEQRDYVLALRRLRFTDGAEYARANYKLGEWFADDVLALLEESEIDPASVDLIGSHGQTVSGHPHWELGDISVIAQRTGITTIGDFRPADVAAGGNGTPCTCTYDSIMLRPARGEKWRLAINVGGTSSITFLPPWPGGLKPQPRDPVRPLPPGAVVRGLDPGLGVFFMDLAARLVDPQIDFDDGGRLARSGTIHEGLLAEMLSHAYYAKAELPIGVGPDDFPETLFEDWRDRATKLGLSDVDFLATLTDQSARQIALAAKRFGGPGIVGAGACGDVLLRGGVVRNDFWVERLLHHCRVELGTRLEKISTLASVGIEEESWENAMYAIFGFLCWSNMYNFVPSCTGASRPVVGGRIAPGDNFGTLSTRAADAAGIAPNGDRTWPRRNRPMHAVPDAPDNPAKRTKFG